MANSVSRRQCDDREVDSRERYACSTYYFDNIEFMDCRNMCVYNIRASGESLDRAIFNRRYITEQDKWGCALAALMIYYDKPLITVL